MKVSITPTWEVVAARYDCLLEAAFKCAWTKEERAKLIENLRSEIDRLQSVPKGALDDDARGGLKQLKALVSKYGLQAKTVKKGASK